MRYMTLAAALLSVAGVTPALAAKKQTKQHAPMDVSWNRCFDLGMVRGVHIENGELPGWMEACAAGKIPFDNAEFRLVMRPAQ
ncbi:MAG: hypothetical protein KJZ73_00840 [Pseudorhodoplanes sp.]|nr:hypothetical protein [Pseudorhodoplanes sp.]MCL4709766.1 hypothetical protein [Pseudorhodoplanes sp.]GIK79620.1 MAG: hypothetical protein BroJett024_07250 [Alphaproteobacteria bacterium]